MDEIAGVAVRANLRGTDRVFVEMMFTPVQDNFTSLAIACTLAARLDDYADPDDDQADPLASFDTGDTARPVFIQHPDDPIDITDPHAHDLTLDQAEILHQALGYLLSLARVRVAA
jgi:hypothetical protein